MKSAVKISSRISEDLETQISRWFSNG